MDSPLTPQEEEREACMRIVVDEWMHAEERESKSEVATRISDRITARGVVRQREPRFGGVLWPTESKK